METGDWFFLMCIVGIICVTVQNCLSDYWKYKSNKKDEDDCNR